MIPAYGHLQGGLAIATGFLAPHLARFVPDPRSPTRVPSSSPASSCPTPSTPPDGRPHRPRRVRRFVRTFVTPALTHKEP